MGGVEGVVVEAEVGDWGRGWQGWLIELGGSGGARYTTLYDGGCIGAGGMAHGGWGMGAARGVGDGRKGGVRGG